MGTPARWPGCGWSGGVSAAVVSGSALTGSLWARRPTTGRAVRPPCGRFRSPRTPSWSGGAGGNRTLVRQAVTTRDTTIPGSRLYGCRTAGSEGLAPTAGSFSGVSGLSRRQRSLPAVLHCFCCRAAVDRPRVPLLVAVTLIPPGDQAARANSPSAVLWVPRFRSLSNSGRTMWLPVSTSKPISPVCTAIQLCPCGMVLGAGNSSLPGWQVPTHRVHSPLPVRTLDMARAASRSASRLAMTWRLSNSRRPRPIPSSTLARPSLK